MRLTRETRLPEAPKSGTGEPLCRLCLKPKSMWEKGRRRWCSDVCVHRFMLATHQGYLRQHTLKRDRGVCASCGLDCVELKRRYDRLRRDPRSRAKVVEVLREHGFDLHWGRSLWDADHIEPLAEGGSTGLDNVQTLCVPCHKEKTAEQASRKGKQRRLIGQKALDTKKLWNEVGLA